jgi:rhamnose transport system permease protein
MSATNSQAKGVRRRIGLDQLVGLAGRIRELGLLGILLLVVIVVSIQVPRFLSPGNLEEILLSISILAIVAVGQTLVILTRNIDLSVGSMLGLTAFVVADFLKLNPGISIALAVFLGLALGLLMGAINGIMVTVGRVPSIIVTLGTLYVYRGLVFWISGGRLVSAADVPQSYLNLATARILGIPALIFYAAVTALIFAYLLRYSRVGRELYAIGSNPEAARMVGIRREALVFGAFLITGLLCGLAGILWSARYGTVDAGAGTGFELEVVAAVVVGGVTILGGSGTVLGAVLGVILLGTIENSLTLLKMSQFWLQAVYGLAILVAITIDALITRRLQQLLIAWRQR